eukprot:gnl/MRDRNA2_/MRDRNA2_62390_c0_seq1.p1 gnl/MRDRNA2_/MRDRNA2_62390_c0~~gnl/MRDRNA2_/MRDRNA2_62390_c0_seq1.p1  ORF type:complete len:362 (+),score=47.74 gnl/MRDRNA2_/MRDRNA2_62390_c0_seq1:82-1167(+)
MSSTEVPSPRVATESQPTEDMAQSTPVSRAQSFVSAQSADARPALPECAICLETSDPTVKVMLSCGHLFCRNCIFQYVGREYAKHQKVRCPQCKRELLDHEVTACLELPSSNNAAELLASIRQSSNSPSYGSLDADPMLRCTFEQIAHCGHMKCCPSCNALIEKNGGCDHMTCRCGHTFNWSEVPVPPMSRPCNCVHPHPKFGVWGTTCSNSSWIANAKLTARRTGLVTVGVPVLLCGGVAILAVTAYCGAKVAVAAGAKRLQGLKSAVETCQPDNLQARVAKAQLAVDEAERLVDAASLEVQQQETKWFNGAATEDAKKSLAAKRALLAKAQERLQAIDPEHGHVEGTQVTLPCCHFFGK